MPFDILAAKEQVRRTVHNTFGVPALYVDKTMSTPVPIKARWHNKIQILGDEGNDGYSQVVETIDRIVLIPGDTPDIEFRHGGKVTFVSTGQSYLLDVLDPETGPLERVWHAREYRP